MDLVACLLPAGLPLHLETWSLDEAAAQLTWRLTSTQAFVVNDPKYEQVLTRRVSS